MKDNRIFLMHILDEVNFLLKETKDRTFESFMNDEVLKRASARSFEIIGEAVKNLSGGYKEKYNQIDWRKIAGMRDKIIHYYFGVNYNIVWATIREKLPELKEKLEVFVKEKD